jgi:hypothetical protein
MLQRPPQFFKAAATLLLPAILLGAQAGALKLRIVEGDGAVNNIQQRVAREPVVQVTDEQDRPVEGALVVFTAPERGAGGVFSDGGRVFTARTGADGRAVAQGFQPNDVSGKFKLEVTASHDDYKVTRLIKMKNTMPGAISGAKLALILAITGAAVAGGIYAYTAAQGGSSAAAQTGVTPAPLPSIILTPGQGSVGPPI